MAVAPTPSPSSSAQVEIWPLTRLRPHPQAQLVPDMTALEFAAHRTDIAVRGLTDPLEITQEGLVLDGRQRLRAARQLGLELVAARVVTTDDPCGYALRAAIQRRNLTPSQRAALAVLLDGWRIRSALRCRS